MREIAIRVPADSAEPVLDELLPIAPHGVFDVRHADEVELRVRGHAAELPSRAAVAAAAGRWLLSSSEREVPDDWREQRRLDTEPLVIGERLVLRPPWAPSAKDGLLDIVLDFEGAAFGTGVHPTTRGCLEALLELEPHGSFADLGCGSGVLAIVAFRLGLAPVTALDHDADAVAVASANAAANAAVVDVREADLYVEPVPAADVVAANVPSDLHPQLATSLAPSPPRALIVAGAPAEDTDAVLRAYASGLGLTASSAFGDADWPVFLLTG
jgi:ribosomal protein L11 methyltransferase